MEISSTINNNYSQIPKQNRALQELSQDQRDQARGVIIDKVAINSKQSQIDAYIAGSSQANDNTTSSTQESTQNYANFTEDVRKADAYATLVQNEVDFTSIVDRPSTLPIYEPSQEQKDSLRQTLVSVAGYQSTQSQIEAYKAGSSQETTIYNESADYINNYNEFASDVRRTNAINTYIENSNLFGIN